MPYSEKTIVHGRYTRKRQKRLLLMVTWCALLCSLFVACGGESVTGGDSTPTTTATTAVSCLQDISAPVTLNMSYGSEKEAWLKEVSQIFNNSQQTTCSNTAITVEATPVGSGKSMQDILEGVDQPDVWSPAGSLWLPLLNVRWEERYGKPIIGSGANDSPSLVNSPVVIAMWKPQAEALGWPEKPIGWDDIAELSTNPQGWRAYGYPEFGQFKFGHTHPEYSNSGLNAVVAMNYAATDKLRGLTVEDVRNKQTQEFITNVESSIIHYGDSTGFFAEKMFGGGPNYLSAAVMYENLVAEANDGQKYPDLAYPVVAIYPEEGTFNSDHPYAILQADWVTAEKNAAAELFRDYLLSEEIQAKALGYGFRPAQGSIGAPLDAAHGVDPSQPANVLQVPNGEVIQNILANWREQRRNVDVTLILDRSGSMEDSIDGQRKIDGAKEGLKQFVNLMGDNDALKLTIFGDNADVITPMSSLGEKRQEILTRIDNIVTQGYTRLYDTIIEEAEAMKDVESKNIHAIIVLSDGDDTASSSTIEQVLDQVAVSGEDAGVGTKIFTIAYGDEARDDILTQISEATGGKQFAGEPQTIREVYEEISRFF